MTSPPVARAGRTQVVRHVVLSAALWVAYVLYWRIVLARGVEREAAFAFGLLGFFIVLQVAATQAWVLHNRRLSRRHEGRRHSRAPGSPAPGSDFHGRSIRVLPEGSDLRRVPMVIVVVDEEAGEKRFETGISLSGVSGERRAR